MVGNSLPDRAIMEMGVSPRVHFIDWMISEQRLVKKFPARKRRDRAMSVPSTGLGVERLVVGDVMSVFSLSGAVRRSK